MPISGPATDHKLIRHWADSHKLVPAEKLPARVDASQQSCGSYRQLELRHRKDVRAIVWEGFFAKFEQHGLSFVYDDDGSGYNEILQIEEKSPYRGPEHQSRFREN